jgi:hypothetical protein
VLMTYRQRKYGCQGSQLWPKPSAQPQASNCCLIYTGRGGCFQLRAGGLGSGWDLLVPCTGSHCSSRCGEMMSACLSWDSELALQRRTALTLGHSAVHGRTQGCGAVHTHEASPPAFCSLQNSPGTGLAALLSQTFLSPSLHNCSTQCTLDIKNLGPYM